MVRWVWSHRLIQGVLRYVRLFVRWLLVWITYLLRRMGRSLRVAGRILTLLVHPRNPNNVFIAGHDGSLSANELAVDAPPADSQPGGTSLLWAAPKGAKAQPVSLDTTAVSLWRGTRPASSTDAAHGAEAANRRFAFLDVLAAQIRRLKTEQIRDLDAIIARLARKWLDVDQRFEYQHRRNRLDVDRTLRHNIPRYAGKILNFQLDVKERPVSQLSKPAKLLIIGDVSHSMVHYVSILLYFFHRLNFRFVIDSFVFSEHATHSTPYLNGLGTFEEKVERLMLGAKSWNAGTRFGSALAEIADQAAVDEHTYVIIATDGKVSLQADEAAKIERYMKALRSRAKQVIFVTPSAEFSDGAAGRVKPERLGSFKYDFYDIPIFAVGPPLWYGTLGQYADRLYLVRTVQDLIEMSEDLILASQGS